MILKCEILIHRPSCKGTMRSASYNLEYTLQQDAVQYNIINIIHYILYCSCKI
jgi:hypothetical protein